MSDFKTALFIGSIGAMMAAPFVLLVAWLPLRRKSESDEVSHAERMAVLRNTVIIVVLIGAGIMGAYLVFNEEGALPTEASGGAMGGSGGMPSASLPALPDELAGLPRAQLLEGADASQAVASMNPGGQFPVTGAVVGVYAGEGETAELRVAALPAPEMASQNVQTLVQMFSGGQMLLGKAKEVEPGVFLTEGPESVNYFFAVGPNVVWVDASTPALAEAALEQVKSLGG